MVYNSKLFEQDRGLFGIVLSMSVVQDQNFWNRQTTSLHRFSDESFYKRKAQEHAELMSETDRAGPIADLGCGAGELLSDFSKLARVSEAFDYSESMLNSARAKLEGTGISLQRAELFPYIEALDVPVWITTAAINQYLEPDDMRRFLAAFSRNKKATSLYLFDCVDHVRHALLYHGIGFTTETRTQAGGQPDARKSLGKVAHRLRFAANLLAGKYAGQVRRLGQEGMGLGFLPSFWNDAGRELGLSVTCVGSREYEYRYHAIFRKAAA